MEVQGFPARPIPGIGRAVAHRDLWRSDVPHGTALAGMLVLYVLSDFAGDAGGRVV